MERTAVETMPTGTGAASNGHGGMRASAVKVKLYGLRGSAPSFAAELMLLHKGIHYRRVNMIGGLHRRRLPAKGFPGRTVPAMLLNGRHVQTNREIARALDEIVPDPPLFPADPGERARVEEAELFGDEVLQPAVRRMILWSLGGDPDSVRPHPGNGRLPIPRNGWLRARLMPKVFKTWEISDDVVRRDFEALPGMLDRMDAYAIAGVLDGARLNAADFEIAPLIAALLGIADLGAEVGKRPVAGLASRVMPR